MDLNSDESECMATCIAEHTLILLCGWQYPFAKYQTPVQMLNAFIYFWRTISVHDTVQKAQQRLCVTKTWIRAKLGTQQGCCYTVPMLQQHLHTEAHNDLLHYSLLLCW